MSNDTEEELSVNEDASLTEFVEEMRRQSKQIVEPLFGEDTTLRLAALNATFVEHSVGFAASPGIEAQWFDETEFEHGLDEYQRLVQEFATNNDLEPEDAPQQWEVVEEELDEMREEFEELRFEHVPMFGEWSTAAGSEPVEPLAEEMADAIFTIHLLASMLGIDLRREFIEKANYNLEKSGQRNEDGKIIDDAEETEQ
jgi:NTP pyrophosphatase (non-canonical NTP hydrolase)